MSSKKEALLDIFKLNYELHKDLNLVIKYTMINTDRFILVNNIIIQTIINSLVGQIPEIISIDSIVAPEYLSSLLVFPLVSLCSLKNWTLKPVLFKKAKDIQTISVTHGQIRRGDNIIILSAILDGHKVVNCIDKLRQYKTNIIKIISLIDPLNGSKEMVEYLGFQPISIFTIQDIDDKE